MILRGSYDFWLVGLSIIMAMIASYAALDLSGKVTAAHGRAKWFWLLGGASVMGFGIWSMHYIGMLAFNLPVPVLYHYPTVIVSLIAAVLASAVALFTVSRERLGVVSGTVGSLAMGCGIAAMHYIGMQAMRLPAVMELRWGIVVLSIIVAILISLVALIFGFRSRQEHRASRRKVMSALIMGAAIPLMHYTGMWAVRFHASDLPFSTQSTLRISLLGIVVIGSTTLLLTTLTTVTAFVDNTLAARASVVAAAREGEARFRLLAETIPQIVWTALPSGDIDYCNQRWTELTGFPVNDELAWQWEKVIHPDDVAVLLKSWEHARETGTPFEVESRLQNRSGGFRWFLVRANPVRDSSGKIVRWFGSCTDIEEQMRNQQILEEQIREHTAALVEANARLETEMRERALAQQELNQQNERMVQELTRRTNRATTLARLAELLQGCADLADVFSVVAGMAPKIFPKFGGAVLLLNSSRDLLDVAASWSDCSLPVAVSGPLDCWALRTGHSHIVSAGDHTAACRHAGAISQSYVCLPLLSQGEAIGILHFQALDPADVAESELSLATTFAEQIGLSISNLRLREALRNQSIRDPLTGLFNRRYLEETMRRETRRAVRAEYCLGILVFDLDHFKKFNDTYGHHAGDTVLRETANFLVGSVRSEDIVCRFGGEEFVIVLPLADLKASVARAERIRTRLRELTILHQGQSLGTITVSIGVAVLPDHGTEPKTLFEAADAALYRAKREGRDRVMVAEALPEPESDPLSPPTQPPVTHAAASP
jgi:diguanylate cyclase (GGDEF)-like protein/PAS domain S-box-containing protein